MLKVVQLQTSKHSAGSSALRLHNAFIDNGIDSSILSLQTGPINDNRITFLPKKSRVKARIDSELKKFIVHNNLKKYGTFSYPLLGNDVSKMDVIQNADVIYLHWILAGFLNITNIDELLSLKKPVIIVMHDMWYITGGCHYSFECEKYIKGCNYCPALKDNSKNDLSAKEFKKKIKLYKKYDNIDFVSPSKWLFNCAKNSLLLKDKSIFYIPNAIDNKLFKPFDKNTAKTIFNIDTSEIVIAFGAVKIDSVYKGWPYLQKALEILKQKYSSYKILILVFGSGYDKQIADAIPFKTQFLGNLKDEYSIIVTYNAADVFVVPSLAENQPTVVMESLCCGTPVVGFNVGGIPDMISHKKNGYLAEFKNSEDIADGIHYCIENKVKGKILPSFERDKIVKKHLDLMNELLKLNC